MQDDVDTAWRNLMDAMANLRLKPDKGLLEDLISQAQGLDAEDYEAGSFSAMLSVLAEVQAVYDNPEAAQEEVETAEAELQAALDQLAAKADDTEEPAAPADPPSPVRLRGSGGAGFDGQLDPPGHHAG